MHVQNNSFTKAGRNYELKRKKIQEGFDDYVNIF